MALRSQPKERFPVRHRFSLFFFLYTVLYHVIIVNRLEPWKLNNVTHVQYCVDFSYGFASKLLPGAVFQLFFGPHASEGVLTAYVTVVILFFFAGLAIVLEKFMLRIPQENRGLALFLLLFFLSGAYTFSIYTKWVGMLDTYWLLISLLFFVFLEHRRLRWLIPLLYVLALMIHFSALVFFITLFSIVLLYRISIAAEKRERRTFFLVFSISIAITIVAFWWLLMNESQTLCSIEEFHTKLSEHGTDYYFYHDYSFFRIWGGESFIPDTLNDMKPSLAKFCYLFYYQVKLNYGLYLGDWDTGIITTVGGLLILLPILGFFFSFHWHALRQKGNFLRRFCAFLMIVQFPFVFVLGLLFATGVDMTRYLTHGFLVAFICVLTVLYYEDEMRSLFFARMQTFARSLPLKLYFFAYATITLLPC